MAVAEQTVVKPRRSWIAALLTLLAPGFGQLYAGEPRRALTIYLGFVALIAGALLSGLVRSFWGLVVALLAGLLYLLWTIWDAVSLARRNRDYVLKRFNRWYAYAAVVLLASVLSSWLVERSPLRAFWIPSGSMEPVVRVGDHVYADMWHYRSAEPDRGDLVIYTSPDAPGISKIARIIGLGGERIEIRDKVVYVDGRRLADPWGQHLNPVIHPANGLDPMAARDNPPPLEIPAGTLFLLGDNRDNSHDSRFFGPVPRSALQGRLLYVYWADDKSRIGQTLK